MGKNPNGRYIIEKHETKKGGVVWILFDGQEERYKSVNAEKDNFPPTKGWRSAKSLDDQAGRQPTISEPSQGDVEPTPEPVDVPEPIEPVQEKPTYDFSQSALGKDSP